MRVVLDTNVLVSTYLSARGGTIARLLDAWQQGTLDLVVSQPILDEYQRVLSYPRLSRAHGKDSAQLQADIDRIRRTSFLVRETPEIHVVERDPSDNIFLECAVAGAAEIIVSGDSDLLDLGEYQGIQILSAAAFVALLEQAG